MTPLRLAQLSADLDQAEARCGWQDARTKYLIKVLRAVLEELAKASKDANRESV